MVVATVEVMELVEDALAWMVWLALSAYRLLLLLPVFSSLLLACQLLLSMLFR